MDPQIIQRLIAFLQLKKMVGKPEFASPQGAPNIPPPPGRTRTQPPMRQLGQVSQMPTPQSDPNLWQRFLSKMAPRVGASQRSIPPAPPVSRPGAFSARGPSEYPACIVIIKTERCRIKNRFITVNLL